MTSKPQRYTTLEGALRLSGPAFVGNEDPLVCVVEGDVIVPASIPDPIAGDALAARLAPTLSSSQSWCEHVLSGQRLLRD